MKKKPLQKAIAFAALIFCFYSGKAQDTISHREIGIGFSGFSANSFGLRYQWGTDQSLFRITLISLGANNSNSTNTSGTTDTASSGVLSSTSKATTPINVNFGVNLSWARIQHINNRFGFMWGVEIGTNISYVQSKTDYTTIYNNLSFSYSNSTENATTYKPFIGILLGARYQLNSSFYLYAEVSPNIYYSYESSTSTSTSSYSIGNTSTDKDVTTSFGLSGLQNSAAFITIGYRIK